MAAALYLHNATFSPEASRPPDPNTDVYTHHGRHPSSQSTVTVAPSYRLSQSDFSYPTEPLLHADTSGFLTYADLLSTQPTYPGASQPGWDLGLSLAGDPPTINERKDAWQRAIKRRLKWLALTKGTLEVVMGAWAAYNTARYLAAFMGYSASGAQAASLALGASTTLSISFLTAAALISSFASYIVSARISHQFLHVIRITLRGLATLFLLLPAIVTFALVFAWRDAPDSDLRFQGRCHWDIDIVWSGPGSRCEPNAPSWRAWLAASIVRLIFTLIIVITYHLTSRAYADTRRPPPIRDSRFRRRKSYEPSYWVSEPPALSPTSQPLLSSKGTLTPSSPISPKLTQQSSLSTLVDHSRTRNTSGSSGPPISLVSARSRGSMHNLSPGQVSRVPSDADMTASGEAPPHAGPGHPAALVDSPPAEASGQASDPDLYGFVDRFRALVTQVSRVDDGLDIVRRESMPKTHPPSSYPDLHATQVLTAEELESLFNYDEPQLARTQDDHVMVLNRYIRRMPTIESLGSREMGSVASSAHRNGTFRSNHSSSGHAHHSRPPTRAGTGASEAAVECPSHNSSMNVSSIATGGHGGWSSTGESYHSTSNGDEVVLENSDTLVESPTDVDPPSQGQGIIK